MRGLIRTLRNHPLVISSAVAVVPVVLLLGMQWVWLSRLEAASALAHEAALRSSLEAVGTDVELFYRSTAERLLNVPASMFLRGDVDTIGDYWREKPHAGVRRLFVADYTRTRTGNFFIYDPETSELTSTVASDESLAIVLAALPWQTGALGAEVAGLHGLHVNERNPHHRIVLSPIRAADGGDVVGIAGMILDVDYFESQLLQRVVAGTLPIFFSGDVRHDLRVTVRDDRGARVFGELPEEPVGPAVRLRFPFVFTDWTMEITSRGDSPEQWARTAFIFNMGLGLLLAIVLLGGVGLALWAARKTMHLSTMKSDFVSNVSHELRTPLASIRVFAELLRRGKTTDPAKVREYGEYIDNESRRLSRLIDNILDFSRIESQQKVYTFRSTDVVELVAGVVATLALRLERTGYRLDLELPEDVRPVLAIDGDAIAQALHNLIDNAAKYSEAPSTIRVTVAVTPSCLVITVRDRGIGIAKKDQAKIFDRFHRVGTGLVHDVKGSGLGLAIVAHVMQAHGGAAEVESELGAGSTFCLRLPLRGDGCQGGVVEPSTGQEE
jgi:signal transduction histidine kinase